MNFFGGEKLKNLYSNELIGYVHSSDFEVPGNVSQIDTPYQIRSSKLMSPFGGTYPYRYCVGVTPPHSLSDVPALGNSLNIFYCLEPIGKSKKPHIGPGRTGQIFVYFAKKSVTSSLRQVRPAIFRSTKFCQGLPNFKHAVVLPRSRTNFCQA